MRNFLLPMPGMMLGIPEVRTLRDSNKNPIGEKTVIPLLYLGGYASIDVDRTYCATLKPGTTGTAFVSMVPSMSGRSVNDGKFAFVETGFKDFRLQSFEPGKVEFSLLSESGFILPMPEMLLGEIEERQIKDENKKPTGEIQYFLTLLYLGGFVKVEIDKKQIEGLKFDVSGVARVSMQPIMTSRSVKDGKYSFIETGFNDFRFVDFTPGAYNPSKAGATK